MNDNAKKWVAALRSGEYMQGLRALVDGDCYCCLGVACKVYEKEVGPLPEEWRGKTLLDDPIKIVRDWLGLRDECGLYESGCLTEMNDARVPFPEIADIIESEPVGLFVE